MLAGAAIVFFAYIGFDSISTHAEEARNPSRDVPIGIMTSLVLCTVSTLVSGQALATGAEARFEIFNAVPAVSDGELAGMRGGFFTAAGAHFDFGASIQTMVNGQLALQTNIQWTPAGSSTQQLSGLGTLFHQRASRSQSCQGGHWNHRFQCCDGCDRQRSRRGRQSRALPGGHAVRSADDGRNCGAVRHPIPPQHLTLLPPVTAQASAARLAGGTCPGCRYTGRRRRFDPGVRQFERRANSEHHPEQRQQPDHHPKHQCHADDLQLPGLAAAASRTPSPRNWRVTSWRRPVSAPAINPSVRDRESSRRSNSAPG